MKIEEEKDELRMIVKLSDIIEAIEAVNNIGQYFLDWETGEIVGAAK